MLPVRAVFAAGVGVDMPWLATLRLLFRLIGLIESCGEGAPGRLKDVFGVVKLLGTFC
jgi:hypothetical protein